MRFAFTDDQLLFRDAVRDFLTKECPPELVRASWTSETGRSDALWHGLAELGVVGLTTPEAHGGLGMDALDLVLLLEEAGRAALAEPILETTAVVAPVLAAFAPAEVAAEWLPKLASGEARATIALGEGALVPDAHVADLVVAERAGNLVAVPGDRVQREAQPSVDGARRLFSVTWDPADEIVLASGDAAQAAIGTAADLGALAASAELVGLAGAMLDLTVDYVAQREQFGVPVGSFQAVKHHLADALLALEFAKPVVYRAAYAVAHDLDTAPRDVSMAKAYASDAAMTVARQALQCHGAIGYTDEYDLHLWMKRVWALAATWGDADLHRERVAASVLGPRPAH